VDVARNRLIYDSTPDGGGYAISLTGLQLVQNGPTPVTLSPIGTFPGVPLNAGYRKIDGQVYYHPQASDELRRLDVGPTGQITGFTAIGNFNGTATPNSITGGDIDFAADGAVWVTGNNDTGNPRLWGFDFNSLNQLVNVATTDQYNGITFNAAGDTLYGYRDTTGQYGIIDRATGGFQSVVATDLSVFGVGGDLATGTLIVVQVPEPSALAHVSAAVLGSYFARRTHQKRRQHYR
jgi:hypothetical protein